MSGTLALFPGLAAATPGMGRWAVSREGAAREVVRSFSTASGLAVEHLVATAPAEELQADRCWEVATVATELAAAAAYRQGGAPLDAALGFSIGSYAALGAASSLTAEQIVTMLDTVLEASQRLGGEYGMVAITGVDRESVAACCAPGRVELAAVLTPNQFLVAGDRAAVRAVAETLASRALRVTALSVRWPLHTTLMAPVADHLARSTGRVGRLADPTIRVYSTLDGAPITTGSQAWELLVDHLQHPQDLPAAVATALADGVDRCVELGPGDTLRRTVRYLHPGALAVESTQWAGRVGTGQTAC